MSGETMREAVARAIFEKEGYCSGEDDDPFRRLTWEEAAADEYPVLAAKAYDMADAAIRTVLERLREPSEAMLAAAVPEPVWLYEGRPKDYPDQMRVAIAIERAAAFQRWRAMVEAMEEELGLTMLDAAVREVG